jgi:hypothetical protein
LKRFTDKVIVIIGPEAGVAISFISCVFAVLVGRRRHRAASHFSFADESDIFTIRLDGEN